MKKTALLFLIFILLISCKSNEISVQNQIFENSKLDVLKLDFGYKKFVNNTDTQFSIAIIPDSQGYVDFRAQLHSIPTYPIDQVNWYFDQLQFIANNSIKNGGDFSFAIHTGDQVDHRAWQPIEWKRAAKGLQIINNEIPFITVIGNHDYDKWIKKNKISTPKGTKLYKKYFGPQTDFYNNKSYIIDISEDGTNICARFTAANKDFLVIALELDPTEKSITWARNIIKEQNLPTIIVTHSYLLASKDEKSMQNYTNSFPMIDNTFKYSAQELWRDFISKENNIFLVICGHSGTEKICSGYRVDINDYGNKTYSILSNYQFRKEYLKSLNFNEKKIIPCGDGWFTTINFDLEENKIFVKAFSSLYNNYNKDEEIILDFDFDSRF